jgi:hypothetical protein
VIRVKSDMDGESEYDVQEDGDRIQSRIVGWRIN